MTTITPLPPIALHDEPAKSWLLHHLLNTEEKPSIHDSVIEAHVRTIAGDPTLELPVLVDELYREGLVSLYAMEHMYLHSIIRDTLLRNIAEHQEDSALPVTPLRIEDLSQATLLKAAKDLVQFYDFTFFGERNVSESTGLVFAMEMQVCQLGLVHDDDDIDTATLMNAYADALHTAAQAARLPGWERLVTSLPYGTFR